MHEITFSYDKNSNPPSGNWSDDGRINIMLFANVEEFQKFLKGLGVATQLISGSVIFKGGQLQATIGTYIQLVGLITLQIMWKKHSLTHHNGLKKGKETTLKVDPAQCYLTVFRNADWFLYYQGKIASGGTHRIHINDKKQITIS